MPRYNPEKHHRRSIRLKGYDYSREGLYFITLCCQDREHLFGEIIDGEMHLNEAGKVTNDCWLAIPEHFPKAILHEYVIMPNHVHGIIELTEDRYIDEDDHRDGSRGGSQDVVRAEDFLPQPLPESTPQPLPQPTPQPLPESTPQPLPQPTPQQTRRSIGSIVKGFKIGVTKWIRQNTHTQNVWQRNYYEIIIRDEQAFYNISNYIANNPRNWKGDKFHGR